MLLSDIEIRRLIEEVGFIEDYTDLEIQLQQCGFDLTLDRVEQAYHRTPMFNPTVIDFDNNRRKLTYMEEIDPVTEKKSVVVNNMPIEELAEWYYLEPQHCYVFHTKEKVRIPSDVGAILRMRSSLHRVGIQFTSSCIDPEYYGHLTAALFIPPPGLKIMKGARFCQILSWKLDQPVASGYDGIYKEK